jgi:hypothetical protein
MLDVFGRYIPLHEINDAGLKIKRLKSMLSYAESTAVKDHISRRIDELRADQAAA